MAQTIWPRIWTCAGGS